MAELIPLAAADLVIAHLFADVGEQPPVDMNVKQAIWWMELAARTPASTTEFLEQYGLNDRTHRGRMLRAIQTYRRHIAAGEVLNIIPAQKKFKVDSMRSHAATTAIQESQSDEPTVRGREIRGFVRYAIVWTIEHLLQNANYCDPSQRELNAYAKLKVKEGSLERQLGVAQQQMQELREQMAADVDAAAELQDMFNGERLRADQIQQQLQQLELQKVEIQRQLDEEKKISEEALDAKDRMELIHQRELAQMQKEIELRDRESRLNHQYAVLNKHAAEQQLLFNMAGTALALNSYGAQVSQQREIAGSNAALALDDAPTLFRRFQSDAQLRAQFGRLLPAANSALLSASSVSVAQEQDEKSMPVVGSNEANSNSGPMKIENL